MSSTFGGLNTAYRGLASASQGLNITGQNVANAGTAGYTRQRLDVSALSAPARVGLGALTVPGAGQGVNMDAVSRAADAMLDSRVRSTSAGAGYTAVRAEALLNVESIMAEPGERGISAQLDSFYASWQDIANNPSEAAPAGVLLQVSAALAGQLTEGYKALEQAFVDGRTDLETMAATLNRSAAEVAELNGAIRTTLAAGGSANELMDRRNQLTTEIASIAGGTVRDTGNGMVEVLVGGNALVSGEKSYTLKAEGARNLSEAADNPVRLEWENRTVKTVALSSGEAAGTISVLAPANAAGTGGSIVEAAASYSAFAQQLVETVNAVHRTGETADGRTGVDFFTLTPGVPAGRGLTVSASAADIAARQPGAGGHSGSVADSIAQLRTGPDSAAQSWRSFSTRVGADSAAALSSGLQAEAMANSASSLQLAGASVSLDEESMNLISYQHAYQANARVMSAIDEMLETLINIGR